MTTRTLRVTTGLFAGSLLLGGALALPASAAGPVVTGGLVNVTVVDVLNNAQILNNVGVNAALALAANVCNVPVSVLAAQLGNNTATCTNAVNGTTATLTQTTRR
jgi:hypothetical protein